VEDITYYVPVLEKKTKGHKEVWKGRILNLKGYRIEGKTKEEVDEDLSSKLQEIRVFDNTASEQPPNNIEVT